MEHTRQVTKLTPQPVAMDGEDGFFYHRYNAEVSGFHTLPAHGNGLYVWVVTFKAQHQGHALEGYATGLLNYDDTNPPTTLDGVHVIDPRKEPINLPDADTTPIENISCTLHGYVKLTGYTP